MKKSEKFLIGNIVKTSADLGKLVRQARKEAGLTQVEAAAMCNVGRRFLIELEGGRDTLTLGLVMKVLQRFGLVLTVAARKTSHER